MTIKLYHCDNARSFRAVWALEEMGLPYELETLEFPPRVHHKEFKAINPLGTVPYMIDGAAELSESSGICHYLGDKYGPTPLAVTPAEDDFGAYINWLHRSDATLTFPQTIVLRYAHFEPEERRIPQAAADYRQWFLARWRSVESALETRTYLCAERFTMADIAVGYALQLALTRLDIQEALTPHVKTWWAQITERPAYKRALAR